MKEIITVHCSIFKAEMWKESIEADILWVFYIICWISEPYKYSFKASLNSPSFSAPYTTYLHKPQNVFVDSSCSLGEIVRLVKHCLFQYIIIKLVPEGEQTSADSYDVNSPYSVIVLL